MAQVGKAYGFFHCRASKREFEAPLPKMRENVQTPSELELTLIEGVENLRGDSELMHFVRMARENGCNYVLEAVCPGKTGKTTANEVIKILISAYQSHLYKKGEPFNGDVIFEKDGGYEILD